MSRLSITETSACVQQRSHQAGADKSSASRDNIFLCFCHSFLPVFKRATITSESPRHGNSGSIRRSSQTDLSHSFSAGRLMRERRRTREENHHPSAPILLI